jgi:hypothetical protein
VNHRGIRLRAARSDEAVSDEAVSDEADVVIHLVRNVATGGSRRRAAGSWSGGCRQQAAALPRGRSSYFA